MVKSVLGSNHRGLTDWLVQRISALVMTVYMLGILAFFIMHHPLEYPEWHALFSAGWMKVSTMIFLTSLLFHAWSGMWTIFTDYVKPYWLRLILHAVVLLSLIAFFFAGLLILWSI